MGLQFTNQTNQTPTIGKYVGYIPIKENPPILEAVHLPDFEGFYTFTPYGDLYFNCENKGVVYVKPTKEGKLPFIRKGYTTYRYPTGMFLKYYWPNVVMEQNDYWLKGFEGFFSFNVETKTVWRWESQRKHPIVQDKNKTNRVVIWVKQKQFSVNLNKAPLVLDYR
jgi:hypothetical protein